MTLVVSRRVVLVVEDDDGMREALQTLLGAAGFGNASYPSAEAMLAEGTQEGTLCVITDINLPAMSGLGLLTELRKRGSQLPVIVITAFESPAARREAERLGAVAYLPKPFLSRALLTALESISGHCAPG